MQMSQFEVYYFRAGVFYLSAAFEAYLDTNVSTFPGLLAKSLSSIRHSRKSHDTRLSKFSLIVMRKFWQFFFNFQPDGFKQCYGACSIYSSVHQSLTDCSSNIKPVCHNKPVVY